MLSASAGVVSRNLHRVQRLICVKSMPYSCKFVGTFVRSSVLSKSCKKKDGRLELHAIYGQLKSGDQSRSESVARQSTLVFNSTVCARSRL